MIKKISVLITVLFMVAFAGCITEKKSEQPPTTIESSSKLSRLIADLEVYEKNNRVKRGESATDSGIYIYNTNFAKLYFYNLAKLKSLSFKEKVVVLGEIENNGKNSYVVVKKKVVLFDEYTTIENVLLKGKDVLEAFTLTTVIYNISTGIYEKFDGTIVNIAKDRIVTGVFKRVSSTPSSEEMVMTIRNKSKGIFTVVTDSALKTNGMTILFKNGPKNTTYYLTGEITKGKYGYFNPLLNSLAVIFDANGNGKIELTGTETNAIAVSGLGNNLSINFRLVKQPGSNETDIRYTKTGTNEVVILSIKADRTALIDLSYIDSKSDIVYQKKVGTGASISINEVISSELLSEGEYDIEFAYAGNGRNDDPTFIKNVIVKSDSEKIEIGTNNVEDMKIKSYTIVVQNMTKKAGNIVVNFGGISKQIATTGGTGENSFVFEGEFITTKSEKGTIETFVDENSNGMKDGGENGVIEKINNFGEICYIGIKGKVDPIENDVNVISAALTSNAKGIFLYKEDGYIYSYDENKILNGKSRIAISKDIMPSIIAVSTQSAVVTFVKDTILTISYLELKDGILEEVWKNSEISAVKTSSAVVDTNSNIWIAYSSSGKTNIILISSQSVVINGIKKITGEFKTSESSMINPISYGTGVYFAAGKTIYAISNENENIVEKWKYNALDNINETISVIRNKNISFAANSGAGNSKVYILNNLGIEIASTNVTESGIKIAGYSGERSIFISPENKVYGIQYSSATSTASIIWKVEEVKYVDSNTSIGFDTAVYSSFYKLNKESKIIKAYTVSQGKEAEWHMLSDWSKVNGIIGSSSGVLIFGSGWNIIKAVQQ